MIVLDTHTWIWTINGDEKILKSGFLKIIEEHSRNHTIFIPAICIWELSMLVSKGRVILSENTQEWIFQASSAPGMSIYPLSPEVSYESTVLPGEFHGDPADRMIVATARVLGATLLTLDKQILKYGAKGYVKVLKPKG